MKTYILECNRPYSKVNKSTRAKVAVICAHFQLSVISFCVVATTKELWFMILNNRASNSDKNKPY
jgi:hypothetical protein